MQCSARKMQRRSLSTKIIQVASSLNAKKKKGTRREKKGFQGNLSAFELALGVHRTSSEVHSRRSYIFIP